uniref:Beta-1,4-galactosyltransferase n=1 Tax=Scleropages formosus TaxID=113540 RepID=A0A8C9SUB9_SCLFO
MRDSTNFSAVQQICTLVVVLSFVHIAFISIYYLRNVDISVSFLQFQQEQPSVPDQTERTSSSSSRGAAAELGTPDPSVTVTPAPVEKLSALNKSAPPTDAKLDRCPDPPPALVGPLRIEFSDPVSMDTIRAENPNLREGGRYKPKDCIALQKVAIIIPFRNRDEHLKFWLYYLHPILQRQQLDYGVYVINQDGEFRFNRAKLLNIGYVEALKDYDYECFIFSDVDLIPMDDRNIYKCSSQPRHLSVAIDKFGFRLPYTQIFGGVSALTKEQYLHINGFSNNYWGWGGEDDDIYKRLAFKRMFISRPNSIVGRYRMIVHHRDEKNEPNPESFNNLMRTLQTMNKDGANSLVYQIVRVEKDQLYTKVTVDVGKPAY